MKKSYLVVLLIVSGSVFAQVQSVWTKRFNGPTNSADDAKFVAVDRNGFVYVGGVIPRLLGYPDFAVIKYDQNGDTAWVRYHNSPVNRGGTLHGLAVDRFGNVIVTGASDGANYTDFATVKYDADGNQLWEKRYDGGDIDAAEALAVDESGNIFVTGSSSRVYESDDYLTIKYAPNGDTLWSRRFAGQDGSMDISTAMAIDKLGNITVTGTRDWRYGTVDYLTLKYAGFGTLMWGQRYNGPANGHDYARAIAVDDGGNVYVTGDSYTNTNPDIATIKYSANGDSLWVQRYNGPANSDDRVGAIAVDSSGNVVVVGTSSVSGTGFDFLTVKYNSSGVEQWVRTYAGYLNYTDAATSLAIDEFGNVYVTGMIASSSTNKDFATIKYDSDGSQKWVITYDGPGNSEDIANGICVDTSGYVYVTGSSQGAGTGSDFTTIKYRQTSVGVGEDPHDIPGVFELYQNYPNPFNPSTTIRYDLSHSSFVTLTVCSTLGKQVAQLVKEQQQAGYHDVVFRGDPLASGVYFYRLDAGSFTSVKKLLLLR